jgi:serine/threonine protein phosphatase PrpC
MQQQQQQQLQATSGMDRERVRAPMILDGSGLHVVTEEHSTVGITSIRGLKPGNPNWTNQDNFFVVEGFDGKDINFYCVLDGHGEFGHHVSRYVIYFKTVK